MSPEDKSTQWQDPDDNNEVARRAAAAASDPLRGGTWVPLVDYRRNGVSEITIHAAIS